MRTKHESDTAFEAWVTSGGGEHLLRTHTVQAAFREGWKAALGREPADAGEGERDAIIEQVRAALTRTTRALYRAIRTIDGMSDQTLPLDQFARRSELATIHVEACAILASPDWAARDAALAPPAGSPEPGGADDERA